MKTTKNRLRMNPQPNIGFIIKVVCACSGGGGGTGTDDDRVPN